ncbi:hypothetical protein GQ53DRAFT_757493 [Thozetella sp. PMI_491]|nr:hypothetical protein GQ53DRAFT_757493 [Thozetella sp. PMI_491]
MGQKYYSKSQFTQRSYAGDLWDSVLQLHGHDIAAHRSLTRTGRTAKYNKRYSRFDFEALWEGREHFCPYWDDKPWPTGFGYDPSSSDSDSESSSSSEPESILHFSDNCDLPRDYHGAEDRSGGWESSGNEEDSEEDNEDESNGWESSEDEENNDEDHVEEESDNEEIDWTREICMDPSSTSNKGAEGEIY